MVCRKENKTSTDSLHFTQILVLGHRRITRITLTVYAPSVFLPQAMS